MNKASGYISLHRQILDWGWFKNSNTFHVFVYLLLAANFVDGVFEGQVIKRGQIATSLPKISQQTNLSIQEVRTALSHLISTGEITSKAYAKFRVITIVKYSAYQNLTDKSTGKQQATNRQSTGKQQQYNKGNNVNKGIKNSSSAFQPPSLDEVKKYVDEINGVIDPERFFDYYEVRGWCLKDGRKMSNWKAEIRSWERREKKDGHGKTGRDDQEQDCNPYADISARIPVL